MEPIICKSRLIYRGTADAQLKIAKAVKATDDEPKITLSGYAIVWNVLSDDRGGYRVRLAPNSAIFAAPCLALWNHDEGQPLGNTANNTLRLTPDSVGVKFEIDLPDTQLAEDTAELVEDGYARGMSFSMAKGFEDAFVTSEGGTQILNVSKYTVDEISVMVIGSFREAYVELKDPAAEDAAEAQDGASYAIRHAKTREQFLRLQKLKLDAMKL